MNVCHYVTFLDVTSSCFPSLVPCLKFTLGNVAAKLLTAFSLVLKDGDMESKTSFVDSAFCIRYPENRQFKSCIISRYIINTCIHVCFRFVGSLCGFSYAIALPCLVFMKICHNRGTLTKPIILIHSVFIVFGLANFIAQFLLLGHTS